MNTHTCSHCAPVPCFEPGVIYGDGIEVVGVAGDGKHVIVGNVEPDGRWFRFTRGTLSYLAERGPERW